MKKQLATLLLLAGSWPCFAGEDVDALIKAADRYRSGSPNLRVETQVTVYDRKGLLDKQRDYTVFVQERHRTLVLMRSSAEAGQKLLMLGDDFWLLMPRTARPLRITPSQKLLGDAAAGDIASMGWAGDYTGTLTGEEVCGTRACLHLSLRALRKGVSYQHIELWIGKLHHEPLHAELYVQSEKLAKRARFELDQATAPTAVVAMILSDELSNHKETRIRYVSRLGKVVPDTWLNPMFLVNNPALD